MLDWNEFQIEQKFGDLPSDLEYFWGGILNYIAKHWEDELWLLIYKLSAFALLLYMGSFIYKKEDEPSPEEF
jgi:hypothetical protein